MNGSEQTSLLGRVSRSWPHFFAMEAAAEPGPGRGSFTGAVGTCWDCGSLLGWWELPQRVVMMAMLMFLWVEPVEYFKTVCSSRISYSLLVFDHNE